MWRRGWCEELGPSLVSVVLRDISRGTGEVVNRREAEIGSDVKLDVCQRINPNHTWEEIVKKRAEIVNKSKAGGWVSSPGGRPRPL